MARALRRGIESRPAGDCRAVSAFGSVDTTGAFEQSFFPAFIILHICAALDPHTDGTLDAEKTRKKGIASMPSPRWLATLIVPVMAVAALTSGTAIATADPADDAYLAQLRAAGFSWPPDHDEALTGTGRLICDDLISGWTYEQIAQNIHATLDQRNVAFGDVHNMVSLAHTNYCPWWRCWGAVC